MKTSSRIWAASITTEPLFAVLLLAFGASAHAAPKVIPKDALVLEKGAVIRQFGDSKGKIVARPAVCDELLLLEPSNAKGGYLEVLFLSTDAQKVRRGWILPAGSLYVFPEPRPALPRADATPGVAFPWASKAPQPGDPDYARVTQKPFLFSCLENPHPSKAAAVLSQLLDRYAGELTLEEVVKVLPILRYARDEDRPRIRELLARFKEEPAVKEFIAANPIFGPVIEPETIATPLPPAPQAEEKPGMLMGVPYQTVGIAAAGLAVVMGLVAFLMSRRGKKGSKAEPAPSDDNDGDQGPSIG